jgi:hypothetical protein
VLYANFWVLDGNSGFEWSGDCSHRSPGRTNKLSIWSDWEWVLTELVTVKISCESQTDVSKLAMYSATSGGVLGFNNEVVTQDALNGNQQLVGAPERQLPGISANFLWISRYYTATNEDSRREIQT